MGIIQIVGLVASIILPLWNIPLIARIKKRKSSKDISIYWALGVWICFVLMFPSAILSADLVFKAFSIVNLVIFSIVVSYVLRYR